jgi:hypothetical protein
MKIKMKKEEKIRHKVPNFLYLIYLLFFYLGLATVTNYHSVMTGLLPAAKHCRKEEPHPFRAGSFTLFDPKKDHRLILITSDQCDRGLHIPGYNK